MENIILNISEFIENNYVVVSLGAIFTLIISIIWLGISVRNKNRTIHFFYKDSGIWNSNFKKEINELSEKLFKKELAQNEELKKLRTDFEEKVKFANVVFQEELEKRSHFTQATIDKLRLQIKDLKDSKRRLAIEKATSLRNNMGAILTSDELVEAAEKIYKFYTGK